MTTGTHPNISSVKHDELKRIVAESVANVEIVESVETERTVKNNGRVDVAVDLYETPKQSRPATVAFEIKVTESDLKGVGNQLSRYNHAGLLPVLVSPQELLDTEAAADAINIVEHVLKGPTCVIEATETNEGWRFLPSDPWEFDAAGIDKLIEGWRRQGAIADPRVENKEAILQILADGRANPYLIREETGLSKGDVNTVLNRLGRNGYVEQVTRGLYEITDKGREEVDDV